MYNFINQSLFNFSQRLLFKFDAETVHNIVMQALSTSPHLCLKILGSINNHKKYNISVGDLNFTFPIGLAAGLDKGAIALRYFSEVGFGGVEIGTVTPKPQIGNSKPRMFRLKEEQSLRNSMGFNNNGRVELLKNIKHYKSNMNVVPLGINLGKNKTTTMERAYQDYQILYQTFADFADYLVINVSSPNTPGLRKFEDAEGLKEILGGLSVLREINPCPLFVKLSPDIALDKLEVLLQVCSDFQIAGIIATNTSSNHQLQNGGISGQLIKARAKLVRNKILSIISNTPNFHLIGVGGIDSFDDLYEFWEHGGKMTQVFSSYIYQGTALLANIQMEIDRYLMYYKFNTLEELLENINKIKKLK